MGLGMTAAGLVLLGISLPAVHGAHSRFSVPGMIVFEAVLIVLGALLIMGPRIGAPAHRHGVMLSGAAGILFGVSDVAIKALTGADARGYRSPAWDLSPHSIALLLKHGFTYDSSLMGHDYLPYQARDGDVVTLHEPIRRGVETSLVEMPISWSLDDYPVFEFMRTPTSTNAGLMNAGLVGENWFADYQYMADHYDWGILTYTFHPHVIGRGHRLIMLEALIGRLRAAGAVFLTMEEAVAEYRTRYPDGRREDVA